MIAALGASMRKMDELIGPSTGNFLSVLSVSQEYVIIILLPFSRITIRFRYLQKPSGEMRSFIQILVVDFFVHFFFNVFHLVPGHSGTTRKVKLDEQSAWLSLLFTTTHSVSGDSISMATF